MSPPWHKPHQPYVTHPELERSLNAVKKDINDVKKSAVTQPQMKQAIKVVNQDAATLVNGLAGRVGDLEVAVGVLQQDVAALMSIIS